MLMSHLIYATFSFQTRRRLRHSIPSDMDLTPTNSDDEVKELSETLQSMPSPSKSPEAKRGRIGNIDFSFVFEIIVTNVRKSQLYSVYTSPSVFSLF